MTQTALESYTDLIKTVARVEYSRLVTAKHLLDFSELLNIGNTAVYIVLNQHPEQNHNTSYISTAVKWAIRNELRRRYKWYSKKQSAKDAEFSEIPRSELRESVYETILSIDELEQGEVSVQIEDESPNPEENIQLIELKKAIRGAIDYLPPKEKEVLMAKFYKNKKIKDIAVDMGVSPSRVSKLVQIALDKIKDRLIEEEVV